MTGANLRADAIAGITVALVLIPQSMAYAQLAGLPAYYGLYAAFLPVVIGALWGSSHQLATGPVAMVSLLTGTALAQFASPGSDQFIALAITLALMVGIMELVIGVFRLGAIVNFMSHPVIIGFTNAAAIIIALSQLNKLLGVPVGRSEQFMADIWSVVLQTGDTHLPTLAMGLAAVAMMWLLKHYLPKWPGVLVAVVFTTAVSWAIGFERHASAELSQFADLDVRNVVEYVTGTANRVQELQAEISDKSALQQRLERTIGTISPRIVVLSADIEILRLEAKTIAREHRLRLRELRRFAFEQVRDANGEVRFHLTNSLPEGAKGDGQRWRVTKVADGRLHLSGGGEVVGQVPPGLPSFELPTFDWDTLRLLLASAFVISLVGFTEAISIAKAMATRTKQRVDPNQELVGQGLANIVGSVFQSFPVSGSFSRSAVNLAAGARTGVSSVVSGVIVVITLLLLTPLLYHLPQAALAAVIIIAVSNLINFQAVLQAWRTHRHDGIAAIVTFIATLGFAPHLDTGILFGAGLAIVLYLYRTMRPRVAILGRHPDGTLRDASLYHLTTTEHIICLRFDGSLYFANVPYFEEAILDQSAANPKAKYILVVGDGINEIDASGEEMIRHLVNSLRENEVTITFSGLKRQVLSVMEKTGLYALIGAQHFFRTEDDALDAIFQWIADPTFDAKFCPLKRGGADAVKETEAPAAAAADQAPAA